MQEATSAIASETRPWVSRNILQNVGGRNFGVWFKPERYNYLWGQVVYSQCGSDETNDYGWAPHILENDNNLKETILLASYEEGGSILFSKIPRVSIGESGAPTSSRITESTTHSRMEVGGDLDGFHNQVSKDQVSTWVHDGSGRHTD